MARSTAEGTEQRAGSAIKRIVRAWRVLAPDRRLAAAAALGLCLTLFLPWYEETGFASGRKLQASSVSLTGWHAFSWVEAAVLLVAVSVLALIFLRAEGRAFHLPGGDGFVVMLAGAWTCLLLIWRIFDKQSTIARNQFGTTFGIKWGIFVALSLALLMTYAGTRIRAAHQPEPPLPGEGPGADGWRWDTPATANRRAPRAPARAAGQAAPSAAVAVAPEGAQERRAERARKARRATWAEPVAWEGAGEPPLPFDAGGGAGDAAQTLRLVDATDATEPMRLVDATDATEPIRAGDPTDPTEPIPRGDATDATEPIRPGDPTDANQPMPAPEPSSTDPTERLDQAAETNPTLPLRRADRYDARKPPHTKAT